LPLSNEPIISVSGLRGIVGETLTPDVAWRFAAAFAEVLPPGQVVVTRDGRASGRELAGAVAAGLMHDGKHSVLDAGVAICWKADTGEEQWKERLGGTFSASLVLVGDKIFGTDESGRTCIWKAYPNQFELIAENRLGSEAFATPAICGGRLYLRHAEQLDGQRQEFLYCVGERR